MAEFDKQLPVSVSRIPINVIPSAVTDALYYWRIQNVHATKKAVLRELHADIRFVGTAAATNSVFGFHLFTGTLSAADGTELKVILPNPAHAAASVFTAVTPFAAAFLQNGALTMTGATIQGPFALLGVGNQLTGPGTPTMHLTFPRDDTVESLGRQVVLPAGTGMVISSYGAVVAGVSMTGWAVFEEYAS